MKECVLQGHPPHHLHRCWRTVDIWVTWSTWVRIAEASRIAAADIHEFPARENPQLYIFFVPTSQEGILWCRIFVLVYRGTVYSQPRKYGTANQQQQVRHPRKLIVPGIPNETAKKQDNNNLSLWLVPAARLRTPRKFVWKHLMNKKHQPERRAEISGPCPDKKLSPICLANSGTVMGINKWECYVATLPYVLLPLIKKDSSRWDFSLIYVLKCVQLF